MEKKLTIPKRVKETEAQQKELRAEAEQYVEAQGMRPLTSLDASRHLESELLRKRNQPLPARLQTWQERNAGQLLSLAVVIQQQGAEQYGVSIGIDAAVQAASAFYKHLPAEDGGFSTRGLDSRDFPFEGRED